MEAKIRLCGSPWTWLSLESHPCPPLVSGRPNQIPPMARDPTQGGRMSPAKEGPTRQAKTSAAINM